MSLKEVILNHSKYVDIDEPEDELVEKCVKLIKEIYKAQGVGWFNFHPSEPGMTNIERVFSELGDVKESINRLERKLMFMSVKNASGAKQYIAGEFK